VLVKLIIKESLKKFFSTSKAKMFSEIMSLSGESFRHLDGRKTKRIVLGGESYFIKQHFGIGYKEIFKNIFQFRLPIFGASNEWRALKKCQELKINVPKPLGFGQRGYNPAHLQSFIIMEELKGMTSLEDACRHWAVTPPEPAFKYQLIKEVAKIARCIHINGMNHRDFYICHFFLNMTSLNDFQLYLIDWHRAGISRKTAERWIIKDLAGLFFSCKDIGLTQRDWYRFMTTYRNQSLRETIKDNDFWQQVKIRGSLYRDRNK
jgi:heptose I phosphotransferase